jgi:endo-1,4-beta-xylanase
VGSPLWRTAIDRGLVYGSSTATWQISDDAYRRLFEREAAILFTEDDLLWYRLRPTPRAGLDFKFGDRIIDFAQQNGMLVFGAHLVWDEGFGDGWSSGDLFGMSRGDAYKLLFGTVEAVVRRYRGRVAAWSVVNEAVDDSGVRTDVPWYQTIGPGYIAESFHAAHEADPGATLVLNEFGFETPDAYTNATSKRKAMLHVMDKLLGANVPVHALGIQAHLQGGFFSSSFDPKAYRRFLSEVAGRGLKILITELDVLDGGMPASECPRDKEVADIYRRYLDVALDEPAVVTLMTFGLSDRYTWLEEDYPRDDGAHRRPLFFDTKLRPKPALTALATGLKHSRPRHLFLRPPRAA